MLQRFRNADQGNVGMVFALSLLPVVGMAGGALDYTRATTTRQKLQAATDMAALGAATANSVSSDAQRIALAQSLFKANDTSGATVSASAAGDKVTVVADARVKTTLMSVMQVSEIALSVRSTAARATSGPPACVLALNKTVSGAITFSGSADFLAVGCSVHSNSRSPSSLSISGSGSVTAAGTLTAPTSGVYGGVLVFQDRLANVGATNTLNGGASTKLVGAIYTAAQELSVNGGSGFGQQSQLMPIVADQVKFSGSTTAKADVTGFNMAAPLPQFSSEAMLTD